MWWIQPLFLLAAIFVIVQFFAGDKSSNSQVSLRLVGPEETVFDRERDSCGQDDFPDASARAFKNFEGQTVLIASHFITRREVGPDLAHVRHDCGVSMSSAENPEPSRFDDRRWLMATYTPDGRTVFGLVHNEYQGNTHPGHCDSGEYMRCWYNTIALAVSRDGGATFSPAAPPPMDLVAGIPYPYVPDKGFFGVFSPTNIVRRDDGYYYSLVHVERYMAQRSGSCLIRTRQLDDPRSWRAWDGNGFTVTFIDPYSQSTADPTEHVCQPVSPDQIGGMTHSLTFNTYLRKFILVSPSVRYDAARRSAVWGFYFSVSADLINWTTSKLFKEAVLIQNYRCGGRSPVYYPSLLDPASSSRNFETTGRRPYLYFVRFHYPNCQITQDRDLVRIPVEIRK